MIFQTSMTFYGDFYSMIFIFLFALSDPAEKKLQQPCDHKHDQVCQQCQKAKKNLADLQQMILRLPIEPAREKELMMNDMNICQDKITE